MMNTPPPEHKSQYTGLFLEVLGAEGRGLPAMEKSVKKILSFATQINSAGTLWSTLVSRSKATLPAAGCCLQPDPSVYERLTSVVHVWVCHHDSPDENTAPYSLPLPQYLLCGVIVRS